MAKYRIEQDELWPIYTIEPEADVTDWSQGDLVVEIPDEDVAAFKKAVLEYHKWRSILGGAFRSAEHASKATS